MTKEDSRAELLAEELRSFERQLEEELDKDEVDMSKVSELQEFIEEKNTELETLEMDESKEKIEKTEVKIVDPKNEETEKEDEEKLEAQEKTDEEEKQEESAEEHDTEKESEDAQRKTQNVERETQEEENDNNKNQEDVEKDEEVKKEEKEAITGEEKKTLRQWQIKSGIDIVLDEIIRKKYDMNLTRKDFMDIMNNVNVPKVIKEAGKAEQFLKSADDWECVKTSSSALKQTLEKNDGKLPVEGLDEHSYMLMIPNQEVRDHDKDGDIDVDDLTRKNQEVPMEEYKLRQAIPTEVMEKYELLREEEARVQARENRAMRRMASGIARGDTAVMVTSGMQAVTARMEHDAIDAEKDAIEEDYDIENDEGEISRGTPPTT